MFIYKDDMYCECEEKEMPVFPERITLATIYVPFQYAKCIFSPKNGLREGSLFPDLIFPYVPSYGHMKNCPCQEDLPC